MTLSYDAKQFAIFWQIAAKNDFADTQIEYVRTPENNRILARWQDETAYSAKQARLAMGLEY